MSVNKFLRKFLAPALVVGVLIYVVIIKYKIKIPILTVGIASTGAGTKHTAETCPNSFTQLLVRDTCYVCPEGSQGISWVSPGYVMCSTTNNRVFKEI